jgi:hypothetical protein
MISVILTLLALAVALDPASAADSAPCPIEQGPGAAADSASCPIEQVVGQIQRIEGDQRVVHIHRNNREIPLTPRACILYCDVLEAGIDAEVTIDTAKGTRHVGGSFEPKWEAPGARSKAAPNVSVFLSTLFNELMSPTRRQTIFMWSRGGVDPSECAPSGVSGLPLLPLRRLQGADQIVGADLRYIVAAWMPSLEPRDVQARFLGADGIPIVQSHTCLDAHLVMPLPMGRLHPGDHLALEITDGQGESMRYNIIVVEPTTLPQPTVKLQEEWLLAAWRLAVAAPGTHLDAIARLQTAPPESLGAQLILRAVWTDTPF